MSVQEIAGRFPPRTDRSGHKGARCHPRVQTGCMAGPVARLETVRRRPAQVEDFDPRAAACRTPAARRFPFGDRRPRKKKRQGAEFLGFAGGGERHEVRFALASGSFAPYTSVPFPATASVESGVLIRKSTTALMGGAMAGRLTFSLRASNGATKGPVAHEQRVPRSEIHSVARVLRTLTRSPLPATGLIGLAAAQGIEETRQEGPGRGWGSRSHSSVGWGEQVAAPVAADRAQSAVPRVEHDASASHSFPACSPIREPARQGACSPALDRDLSSAPSARSK